jgi:hypothetical protein
MTVHVYPQNDWIEHHIRCSASDCVCACGPRIDYVDTTTGLPFAQPLVVHESVSPDNELWIVEAFDDDCSDS